MQSEAIELSTKDKIAVALIKTLMYGMGYTLIATFIYRTVTEYIIK